MNRSLDRYDIVIVGAGLVGSALACALGGSSLTIAVIEAQPLSTDWPQHFEQEALDQVNDFDARVSALTVASQRWLQSLGVWAEMAAQRISPYRHMQVWDAEGTGSIHFDAGDVNQPVLGHIVENRITACALLRQMATHNNVQILAPASLETLEKTSAGHRLTLTSGQQLETALVVAADGANSLIRQLAEFPMREWDYGHHAIVATIECEQSHQQTAWQRFLPEGPLAFLPLTTVSMTGSTIGSTIGSMTGSTTVQGKEVDGEHFCSIVWSAVPSYAENIMALSDEDFCQQLGEAFEHRLGKIKACSRRFSFPLLQRHAVNYIQPGLALVGDAAHTIHPLAGQGVNLGLMDAQVLSEEILRTLARELNPGSEAVLKRYQRRRKTDNLTKMASMEGFKRLFEQNNLAVRWARNTGMRWLDKLTPIKRRIIREAMGL